MTNPISQNPVQDLAKSLMDAFDKNSDGQLTTDEFSSFLSKLLSGVKTEGALGTVAKAVQPETSMLAGASLRFEGFNFERSQDVNSSAKDAFAMLAKRSGSLPQSKSDAESWFNTHIKAGMEELGHKINWVKGDKFSATNWQGTFTVDFIRGADGPDPAFQWGVE